MIFSIQAIARESEHSDAGSERVAVPDHQVSAVQAPHQRQDLAADEKDVQHVPSSLSQHSAAITGAANGNAGSHFRRSLGVIAMKAGTDSLWNNDSLTLCA
jgi:hypothetical protein